MTIPSLTQDQNNLKIQMKFQKTALLLLMVKYFYD